MKRKNFIKTSITGIIGLFTIPFLFHSTFVNTKNNKDRRIEYYDNDKKSWTEIKFKDVKKDMYVQMFEPNEQPVIMEYKNEKPMYGALVTKDTYIGKNGILIFEYKLL